jgi:serine/threonine protein kinase
MDCYLCPEEDELYDFVLGKIDEKLIDTIADHIEKCEHCELITQRLEKNDDLLLIALKASSSELFLEHEMEFRQAFQSALNESVFQSESSWTINEPPEKLGRYQILNSLGSGSMGVVYLARDNHLNRDIAIKILHFFKRNGNSHLERFLQESRIVSHIEHPNICRVYDAGNIDPFYYMTMSYIDGMTLDEYVSSHSLSHDEKIQIVLKVARAMHVAHEHGVIHRDLKPSNIIVREDGEPVITDFGLACNYQDDSSNPRLTLDGVIIGSPAYMSPEQASCKTELTGPASDVYSLGIILFEMLTGKLPFEGNVVEVIAQILKNPPPAPSSFDCHEKGIPELLDHIVMKAMATKLEDRFSTMEEFTEALELYLSSDPILEAKLGSLKSSNYTSDLATRNKPITTKRPFFGRIKLLMLLLIFLSSATFLVFEYFSSPIVKPESFTEKVPSKELQEGSVQFNIDDPTVKVFIDDYHMSKEALDDPYTLKEGKHTIRLKRGDIFYHGRDLIVKPGINPPIDLPLK